MPPNTFSMSQSCNCGTDVRPHCRSFGRGDSWRPPLLGGGGVVLRAGGEGRQHVCARSQHLYPLPVSHTLEAELSCGFHLTRTTNTVTCIPCAHDIIFIYIYINKTTCYLHDLLLINQFIQRYILIFLRYVIVDSNVW